MSNEYCTNINEQLKMNNEQWAKQWTLNNEQWIMKKEQ